MKKNRSKIILTSIITLAPMFIGIFYWNQLPDKIATHFGPGNVPDGWSSKPMAVIGLPMVLVALHLFCIMVTLNDPKKKSIGSKMLNVVFWIVPVTSVIVNFATYGIALGMEINIERITQIMCAILFMILGNYMSKNRQNYTVGIRLPWTLSSEENWNKTHRLASKLWMIGGLIMLLNVFFDQYWVFFAVIIVVSVIPMIYSFIIYKRQ